MARTSEHDLRLLATFGDADSRAGAALSNWVADELERAAKRAQDAKIGCMEYREDIRFALGYQAALDDMAHIAEAAYKALKARGLA